MKKFAGFLLVFILVSLNILPFNYQNTQGKTKREKTKIVLVHPSTGSINSFIYLIENNIIDIPDLELTALFYDKAKHHYSESIKLLEENKYPYVRTYEIKGNLNKDNLFKKNLCSDEFYKIFKNSDGIIFLGGADIQPAIYGQKTNLLTNIKSPNRHYFELSFLFHLLGGSQNDNFKPYLEEKPDYVVGGICLGMQTMNAAAGGTLYQDIPSEIYGEKYVEDVLSLNQNQQHRNYWNALFLGNDLLGYNFHQIRLTEDKFFITTMNLDVNENPYVVSWHHQAVKDIGKGFEVVSTSMDGKVIEAIAHKKYKNVLGVQFHPEIFRLYTPEGKKYRINPSDTELLSPFEILKKNKSLQFHIRFWKCFGNLFQK